MYVIQFFFDYKSIEDKIEGAASSICHLDEYVGQCKSSGLQYQRRQCGQVFVKAVSSSSSINESGQECDDAAYKAAATVQTGCWIPKAVCWIYCLMYSHSLDVCPVH